MNSQNNKFNFDFETTDDRILGGKLSILQPRNGPRAAIDAIFLASAVPGRLDQYSLVLDAGAGSGVVSLALACRLKGISCIGIDLEPQLVELAKFNSERNGLSDRVRFLVGDVRQSSLMGRNTALTREGFDHVVANPPYYIDGSARKSSHKFKDRAHFQGTDELDAWVRFLTSALRAKGTLTMIHVPEILTQLLNCLDGRFGSLSVFPLFPKKGRKASRILVQGVKASRAPLTLMPGLVLHESNGEYTVRAQEILRDGQALSLNSVVR